MTIRPFQPTDTPAVLELLALNTPQYFAPEERADLVRYLAEEVEDYFVVERGGLLLGAGGLNYFPAEQKARISWDLIHPQAQGQGIGTQLTRHRLAYVRTKPHMATIVVRTTQLVYPFYEKQGFRLVQQVKDYWAPGFDLYHMEQAL